LIYAKIIDKIWAQLFHSLWQIKIRIRTEEFLLPEVKPRPRHPVDKIQHHPHRKAHKAAHNNLVHKEPEYLLLVMAIRHLPLLDMGTHLLKADKEQERLLLVMAIRHHPPPGYGYPPQGGQPAGYPPPPPGYGYPPPPQQPQKPIKPIGHFGIEGEFQTPIKLPEHKLNIDESKFLRLLAGSVSLMKDEKKRIIEAVPKLTQQQVDELIRILEEEKQKFSELDMQHKDQLDNLEKKHSQEWAELEMEMTAPERQAEEDSQAEAIRAQLSGSGEENKDEEK
jgi:hypothetical protein